MLSSIHSPMTSTAVSGHGAQGEIPAREPDGVGDTLRRISTPSEPDRGLLAA
jgi:hypothetical protein